MLVLVPETLLLVQHPDNESGIAADDGAGVLIPSMHTGDTDAVLGSQL